MSEFKPTKKQAEEAQAFLYSEIDAPAFFTRLAERGIQPRNQRDAEDLYQIGWGCQGAQVNSTKSAEESSNPFLAEALNRINLYAGVPQEEMDAYAKAAAEQLPLAKAAALVHVYCAQGGELAEDEVEKTPE